MSQPPILDFKEVTYHYPDGTPGLQACSLAFERGSRNAVIGANGSGKTTLFQHANGLYRPAQGCIRFAGRPLDYSRSGLRTLRTQVGLVFQNPDRQLFSANVTEDVSFGPMNLGLDESTVRERVTAALAAVGMTALADRPVHALSFGQKKRVCIAGVLAMRPDLVVLDEPLAGLDPLMQQELTDLLAGLHTQGITLVISTHNVDFAYAWADTIHVMQQGACRASFAAELLPQKTASLDHAGLTLPAVIGLHAELATRGILPASPSPRSTQQLLTMLKAPTEEQTVPENESIPPARRAS